MRHLTKCVSLEAGLIVSYDASASFLRVGILTRAGADTWHPPALSRTLGLTERAIALATAISIDYDYFSRHSGGFGFGGFGMPIILPGGTHSTVRHQSSDTLLRFCEMSETQQGSGITGLLRHHQEGEAPSEQAAQVQAHEEMMERQKSGGVGGAMGAVGMDSMGRYANAQNRDVVAAASTAPVMCVCWAPLLI